MARMPVSKDQSSEGRPPGDAGRGAPPPPGHLARGLRLASLPLIGAGLLAILLVMAELLLAAVGWGEGEARGGGLALPGEAVPSADATLPDADLFYRLRPAITLLGAYAINAQGYRGPPHAPVRTPGTLRVVCAGDSNTFGLAVDGEDAWPEQLRRILSALLDGALEVEVINAGVPGYSTEQTRRQVRRDLLALEPDVLVVCPTAHNDVAGCDYGGDRAALDGWTARLARLRIARLLGLGRGARGGASIEGPDPDGGRRPRVTPAEFVDNVRAMVALARERDVPVVCAVTPHAEERAYAKPELRDHEELLVRAAREAGACVVDVRPEFEAYAGAPMFSDGIHFLPTGHRLLALDVARAIATDAAPRELAPRRAFLWAWAAPWRDGSGDGAAPTDLAVPPPQTGASPPLYAAVYAALLDPDVDARLLAGDPALPEPLRRFDPLHGRERSPWGGGALLLQELRAADASVATALRAQREEIARHVLPPDPLLVRGGGPAGLPRLSREELAAARALVVLDAQAGALPAWRDRRVGLAASAVARGDVERGLQLLDEAIALHPGHVEARYLRGLALRRAGRSDESRTALEALAAEDPRAPLSLLITGSLARQRGDLGSAARDLRGALAADPSLSAARVELVRVHLARGALDEAERLLAPAGGAALPPGEAAALRAEIARRRAGR
jgi:lysophospholipase L1-like esterase/Flp pilus assembly protein TadD